MEHGFQNRLQVPCDHRHGDSVCDPAYTRRPRPSLLTEAVRLGFSLRIGTTGSHVPHRSLNQGHAAFMPDASWAASRFLPTRIPELSSSPVSTSSKLQ